MVYSQRDPAWANILLGFNTSSQWTIGTAGCYVTAIANVCSWAGNDLNPQQINDICKQNGWFVDGGLLTRDDIPALLCSNLGFVGRTNWSGPTDINFFDDASDPNVAYIIEIDASPRTGIQTHFTMVWSKPDANDLQIDDSWDGVRKALSHYGSPSAVILSAMKFVKVSSSIPEVQPSPKYEITDTYPTGKQIQLNKQPTNLWGMNYDFDYMKDHPVEVHNQGEVWTVTNKVHHQDGYDYYRRDGQVDGFNVVDCDDYTPPAPTPYVLPAAPVVTPKAEKYTLVTTLMTFLTDADAMTSVRAQTTIKPGTYYVWAKNGKAYQLSGDNMHEPTGNWVNTLYNKPSVPVAKPVIVTPPEPVAQPKPALLPSEVKVGTANDTKWMSSYKSFHIDRHSDTYEVKKDLTMFDYSGKKKPVLVPAGQRLNMVGTFFKDNVMFYRTRSIRDEFFTWYYGIPLYDDYGSVNLVKVVETDPEKVEKRISDYTHYWRDDIRDIWDIILNKVKIRK